MPDNTTTDQPNPSPTDLEVFDLDGFVSGAVQPSTVIPVARDRTLGQQLTEASKAVAAAELRARTAKTEGRATNRRAGTAVSPEVKEAREALAALEEQARGTWFYVRAEALTRRVRKQALQDGRDASADPNDIDQDAYNLSVLAMSAKVYATDPRVTPDAPGRTLTVEQWDELVEAIGVVQYEAIIDAVTEVTLTGVSPDFSRPASPSPAGGTSSAS